ncbi:lamin tail domain-containing protein [Actinoplanes sp. NPDC051494]|uniref:lamin tail domain-containing protein n=1 Tax=Actinoplanes sp. NPDC051494 TaxID=3363907 RepID=UPI00379BEB2F
MRRTISILAAAAMALAGTVAVGSPASAAQPALRFHGTQYDSPGSDTRSNSSLNAEWISLINSGTKPVNLKGYTIRDTSNHVYTFGNVAIAARGGRIWVHTGKGTNTSKHRYWGSGNYVWNNTGDKATLKNASGKSLDTCSYAKKSGRAWVGC